MLVNIVNIRFQLMPDVRFVLGPATPATVVAVSRSSRRPGLGVAGFAPAAEDYHGRAPRA